MSVKGAYEPPCYVIILYKSGRGKVIEITDVAYVDCDLFRSPGAPHPGCFH
jgi:hypothetical protein